MPGASGVGDMRPGVFQNGGVDSLPGIEALNRDVYIVVERMSLFFEFGFKDQLQQSARKILRDVM